MKHRYFTILTLLICYTFVAQAQSKLHFGLDIQNSIGIREKGNAMNLSRSDSKMHGKAINLTIHYQIASQWETGLGIGLERLEQPGYNLCPFFVSTRYYPIKKRPELYVLTRLGIGLKGSNLVKSKLIDLGAGYKKMFSHHFGLNFSICYSWRKMESDEIEPLLNLKPQQKRHSISFGVGIIL